MSIIKATVFEPFIPGIYVKPEYKNSFLKPRYQTNDEDIYFTEKESKKYENLVNSLLNQKVDTTLNGKIYLGKLSSLPRHKIKDYFKEKNVSKTSRLEQSNTIILNKEHLIEFNKMFISATSYYRLKPYKVYKFDSKEDKEYIKKFSSFSYNQNQIIDDYTFIILISNDDKSRMTPKLINFLQDKKSEELLYKSLYRGKNLLEVHNYLEYILKNPNVKVIFDENLMEPLNEEGFELDEEYLTTLDSMFESKSQDNINLALEMLSNINIEKNSLTIALFLNKHKNKFSWGSGLSLQNNNSFKSTLKYFKSKNIYFASDWRQFSTNLYKLHKDNPENLKIINNFIKQNINLYLKELNKNQSFIELIDFNLALKS